MESTANQSLREKVLSDDVQELILTEADREALRKEIEEQELLLKGYQNENENAVRKMKKMKAAFAEKEEKMAIDRAHIARELSELNEEKTQDSLRTASWLREKLEMQKEANALKEELYRIELRFKDDIDRLRKEKQQLEARAAGVDLKEMEREQELVKALKEEMEVMKQNHERSLSELEKKLQWYAENQEMLNKSSDVIKEKSDTIAELKQRLIAYEGNDHEGSPKKRMSQKTKELEKEVKRLKDLVVQKNPDSLAALIQVSKMSSEESTKIQQMESHVEDLKTRNSELVAKHESQLRSLRQQLEKLRMEKSSSVKIKDLTRQLEDTRSHYSKKVRSLEKHLSEAKRESAHKQSSLVTMRRKSCHNASCQVGDNTQHQQDIFQNEIEKVKRERDLLRRELKSFKDRQEKPDSITRLERQVGRNLRNKHFTVRSLPSHMCCLGPGTHCKGQSHGAIQRTRAPDAQLS